MPRVRIPGGLHRKPSSNEINRWNAAADRSKTDLTTRPIESKESIYVDVRNDTGTDLERFQIANLGANPLWDMEPDSSLVFPLVLNTTFAANERITIRPAVLLENIPIGAIGRACIWGLALATVEQGYGSYASVNQTTRKLKPGSGFIRLLGTPKPAAESILPVLIGDRLAIHAFTSGGIPARTDISATEWEPGFADCKLCDWVRSGAGGSTVRLKEASPVELVRVANFSTETVAANKLIQAKLVDGIWVVDWELCSD